MMSPMHVDANRGILQLPERLEGLAGRRIFRRRCSVKLMKGDDYF